MRAPCRCGRYLIAAFLVAGHAVPSLLAQRRSRPADPFDGLAQEMFGAQVEEAVTAAINARAAGRVAAVELSQRLLVTRRAFWSEYPDGRQREKAEREFADALMEKDIALAMLYSLSRDCPSVPGPLGLVGVRPQTVDGGIPKGAEAAFCAWVEHGDRTLTKMNDRAAFMAWLKSPQYSAYKLARDRSEYVRAGKLTASPPPSSPVRPSPKPAPLSPEAQELQQALMQACDKWARNEARRPGAPMYLEVKRYCGCFPTSLSPADRDALIADFRGAFDRLFPHSPCRYPQSNPSDGSSSRVAPATNEHAPPVAAVPSTASPAAGAWLGKPRKIKHVNPVYPPQASGTRGFVLIDITINPDGSVSNPRVVRSIPLLDQAAIDAVRQWVFAAGEIEVPVRVNVAVTF